MFYSSNRRNARARRGTVTVEFAICAPILFLFLFAILEFGRAQMIRHTLDNAVYEGVRRGMSINSTENKVRERVLAITAPAAIRNPAIGVSLTPDSVTVSASVSLNDHALFSPLFLRNKTLSSTLTLSRR
jgi:Flp pilus assembly protein TadG